MDGQRDKAPPHLPAAASSSPRQAVEHTREVTSRARPAGRRPPSGTAGGVGHPRLATPSAARLPRCGQSQQGWGPLALPPPVASFIFIIFMRGGGGARLALGAPPPTWDPAPAEAQAPVGRPRLPLRGGSFHLVTTQKCVAAAPPSVVPAPGCVCGVSSLRGKEQRGQGKDCSSPLGKVGRNAWRPAARSLLVPVLAFFHGMGFKPSTSSLLGKRSTTELRPLTICFERRL